MPIYQYKCRSCGANIEKMQSFSAESLVECPECHQPALKKVMSAAGIIFKGSGWYITDSKKSSSVVAPSSEGSKSGDGKSGDGKSDSGKSGEAAPVTSGESKSGESKSGESKSSESRSGETKASVSAAAASGTT
jgi:putative FmdB family regulatory protein